MLTLPSSVRVYVATSPIDLRKSFDGLAAAVVSVFGRDPVSVAEIASAPGPRW